MIIVIKNERKGVQDGETSGAVCLDSGPEAKPGGEVGEMKMLSLLCGGTVNVI